jgi:hypothetical protein
LFVIFISLDLVEDCCIAGYEKEEYGDTRLPYVTTIALIFVVICISLDLVEDCSIAGYEEEEYGDTRLPYGHNYCSNFCCYFY